MGDIPRSLAFLAVFVFFCATAIGSVLPEFGNLLAQRLGMWEHFFNIYFLVLGITGIGLALYLGYRAGG